EDPDLPGDCARAPSDRVAAAHIVSRELAVHLAGRDRKVLPVDRRPEHLCGEGGRRRPLRRADPQVGRASVERVGWCISGNCFRGEGTRDFAYV
ncbi:hypothetical protein ACHAWF_001107, partial [Thalassiosira exigua]